MNTNDQYFYQPIPCTRASGSWVVRCESWVMCKTIREGSFRRMLNGSFRSFEGWVHAPGQPRTAFSLFSPKMEALFTMPLIRDSKVMAHLWLIYGSPMTHYGSPECNMRFFCSFLSDQERAFQQDQQGLLSQLLLRLL